MSDLRSFTLWARDLLTRETAGLLQQVYRLDAQTGARLPVPKGDLLETSADAQANRKRIEQLLDDEVESGLTREQAIAKLIKETAFTHLNRLVAFKLMEARGLVRSPVARHHIANGFRMWLGGRPTEEALYNQGDNPNDRDGFGEAPRDRAYRHFLLWQCGELAKEIRVLFDPDSVPSMLFPRPGVLREFIDRLNADDRKDDWAEGNEDTIGWVYQYFNDEEKADVFNRLYKHKQKIRRIDIPAATQLFTPRWMVKYLVHNTLGRLWIEVHPDSNLKGGVLDYLVPFEPAESEPSAKRAVDIRVLDPACGTMHFGMVAFDVLFEMYVEELQRAGSPGWPVQPSVSSIDDIAATIIAVNLYGIDIDLRALQLSALALYLRAKGKSPKVSIRSVNLASADVSSLTDAQIDTFIKETRINSPILERCIRALWSELKLAADAGSLLRPEQAINRVIEEEKRLYDRERVGRLPLPELVESFDQAADSQDFWDVLESNLISAFDEFTQYQRRLGLHEEYFVDELDKGFRLLRFLRRQYDVVLCNPPYSGRKNMNERLRQLLSTLYRERGGDLFAAFIARCQELVKPGGKCGMVTIHSFMFISSYEPLRRELLDECRLEGLVHLGTRTEFEIANKTAQGFVLFTFAKGGLADQTLTCLRLTKEGYGSEKRQAFEAAVANLRCDIPDAHVFYCKTSEFAEIPCRPWVYWIPSGLRSLFRKLPSLGDAAPPRQGLATADNSRYLRYWWEVGRARIGRNCSDSNEAEISGFSWFPYMKGGSFRRWYGNQDFCVNWARDGAEIRCFGEESGRVASRAQNTSFYFRRGVTWTDLTVGKFSARLSPGGFIFDVKGSSAFPQDVLLVLGLLNSSFANYALNLINPTVSYQVGDLARLPVPRQSTCLLRDLVERAVSTARADSEEEETTYDFVEPPAWPTGVERVTNRHRDLGALEKEIDEEVYRLYEISPQDRKAIEEELAAAPVVEDDTGADEADIGEDASEAEASLTVAELAQRWVSYAVGIALGRFTRPGLEHLTDADGLMVVERDHPDDLARRVVEALAAIFTEAEASRMVRAAISANGSATNGNLRDALANYLLGPFFKAHAKRYRKRPVYWLLSSPKQNYSVYLFHERATDQTLATLQGKRYLGGRTFQVKQQLDEANRKEAGAEGREKAKWRKRAQELAEEFVDLEAFDQAITATNSEPIVTAEGHRATARWIPEFDDGVLLNAAPLHRLTPAWKRVDAKLDLSKAWKALKEGEYRWAKTAMRYWPRETLAACKDNRSYRIAHGLE
jgi:hypothetical protein